MADRKRMLVLLISGTSQREVAEALHASRRDVSAAAKVVKEKGIGLADVMPLTESEVRDRWFPRKEREKNPCYLQPDVSSYADRYSRNRKLPMKELWYEYVGAAEAGCLVPYSYQTFCDLLGGELEAEGVSSRMRHDPGAKMYVDWAGDVAFVTDRLTGRKAKAYVFVACLPYSGIIYAEAFADMKQPAWLDGHSWAFSYFGGVAHLLVPDQCSTATDRTPVYVTLINETYLSFAEHHGTAVLPARRRKPKDKGPVESSVNLVEQWAIAPSLERTFHTLAELNDFIAERVEWLNDRPFSDKEGSRRSDFDEKEAARLLPLPAEPYEIYEWRRAKVAPNSHVRIDYMHYSVPYELVGKTVDIRYGTARVTVMHGGEAVASHDRLYGAKNQYSTVEGHMPSHLQGANSPWSRERFEGWAAGVGPATSEVIGRILDSRAIVEQTFVPCLNVLNLSKRFGSQTLERACGRIVEAGLGASYTSAKNACQAIRAEERSSRVLAAGLKPVGEELVDRAGSAGRHRGPEAYARKKKEVR